MTEPVVRIPKLRGVIHAAAVPFALVGTIHLIGRARDTTAVTAAVVYGVTAVALYAVSATYHLLARRGIGRHVLRRADHCTIYLAIAGTYTPMCLLALNGNVRWVLLCTVWAGALAGATLKVFAFDRCHKIGFAMYLMLGWAAVAIMPTFAARPGLLVAIVGGGVLYTVAAILFSLQIPGRNSRWFGFHETWHVNVAVAGTIFYLVNRQLIIAG